MTQWQIKIPFRDRTETPLEALAWAGQLEGEEREVAEFQLEEVGLRLPRRFPTVGDMVDRLDGMNRSTRREVLDCARRSIGLESASAAEARRRFAAVQPRGPLRDSEGKRLQRCPECGAVPLSETGWPMTVAAKRWWCDEHRDLAADGDLEPPRPEYVLSANGQLLPVGEELERLEAEDRKLAEEDRDRREDRQREGQAVAAVRDRYLEQAEPQVWSGVKVKPGGEIVQA